MERCTAPCSIPYMNRINDKSTPMNVHVQTTSQQAGRPRPKSTRRTENTMSVCAATPDWRADPSRRRICRGQT